MRTNPTETVGAKPDELVAEQPVLWLGVCGFAPDERALLETALVRSDGLPRWRTCAFGDADAWCVNGAKVRVMPEGDIRIGAGLPSERAVQLNLADVDRPVAFAQPLASPEFEPRCKFELHSPGSVAAMLLQFDNWLRPLRAQFVIGAQILRRGAELRHGIFHLSHDGNLLAVLDFQQGSAGISPRAHPVDLAEAQWDKRPPGARTPPQEFTRITPAQLAWVYARRTDRDVLPERYRSELIYYRHVPNVPVRWLRDSQLLVLRELSAEPDTLDGLARRTGHTVDTLAHDLACLYYVGSITTTRGKAVALGPQHRIDSQPHSVGPSLDSQLERDVLNHLDGGLTAPALLERHPAKD
jgi:hypothetical protein